MFAYFPENYKWSLSLALLIESIGGGGASFGEIHSAAEGLREAAKVDDVSAWFAAWCALGWKVAGLADAARARGDHRGAAHADLRACGYLQIADRLMAPADPRKLEAFKASLERFDRALPHLGVPIERVSIPYGGGHLSALWLAPDKAGPRPAVLFFDGLDVNKEQLFCFAGRQLRDYGFGVLIVDGPGSGESLRLGGHRLRYDYEAATGACVDDLCSRANVDADRLGLLAVSLGGYHVGRVFPREARLRAAASWGGMWDYHAVWTRRRDLTVGSAVSADHAHICWMLGVETIDQALEALEPFKLDGSAQEIDRPILILHGGSDRQVPVDDARQEFDAIPAGDKTLIVLDEENFGAQHAQIDNMAMARLHLFGWLHSRLFDAAA